MRVGLIDVDGHNFPNLPLMKLSAWHKEQGDHVEFYDPMFSGHMDRVYMSKVFTFTPDYEYCIDADEIRKGGTGYEYPSGGALLPSEVEHIYPDYDLYGITDTAYGFLTRGCPRGCDFCIVKDKEGKRSVKVANLSEFWNGQKYISLLDPNFFACQDWKTLAEQLIASRAYIDFNQGIDIRIMTEEKVEHLKRMRIKDVHMAWDRYEDKDTILPKFEMLRKITSWDRRKLLVYVLCNFDTTHEQDLDRIYTLRDMGYDPYVMIYNKDKTKRTDTVRKLQRYVNGKPIFHTVERFEDYDPHERKKRN